MDTGILHMLRNSIGDDLAVPSYCIHLHLFGVGHELGDDHGMLFGHFGGQLEELMELLLVGAHVHRGAREHVRRSHEHGETYPADEFLHIFHRGECTPFGLIDPYTIKHGRELIAVLCIVNGFGRGTKDRHVLLIELHSEVIRYLSAGGDDDTVRVLEFDDIHDAFEGQFIEIETVTHVIVGRNGLWVVIDHHRAETVVSDRVQCLYTTPVELDRRTDPVGARTEYDDGLMVAMIVHIVLRAAIGEIEVVRLCRELPRQRIDLFDHGQDT